MTQMDPVNKGDALSPKKRRQPFYAGCLKLRFQMCMFLCGAMFCMMFSNLSLSMTLLCMVDDPNSSNGRDRVSLQALENSTAQTPLDHQQQQEHQWWLRSTSMPTLSAVTTDHLTWSPQVQGLLISAINWGRLLTPVTGMFADRFDSSWLLAAALAFAGAATALIPISATAGFGLVIVWRLLIGLSDAVVLPGANQLIAAWYPEKVRNNALSWATGGRQLGVLLVYPIGGLFCADDGNMWGWPFVFYLGSALFAIWLIFWIPFVLLRLRRRRRKIRASPAHEQAVFFAKERPKLPWKRMFKSTALWANIFGVLCHEIPFNIVLVFLPKYIHDVLHFDSQTDGLLSALPILCFLATKVAAAQADHVIKSHNLLAPTLAAKIFNAIGCAGLGGFLLSLAAVDRSQKILVVALLCSATAFAGFHTPGAIGTLVSVAPSFSGTISGLAFLIISIGSMISPIVIGVVVPAGTHDEWKKVMMGAGAIALLPLVVFTKWGSADVQPWARVESLAKEGAANQPPPTVSAIVQPPLTDQNQKFSNETV